MATVTAACSPAPTASSAPPAEPSSDAAQLDAMMLSLDRLAVVAGVSDLEVRYGPGDFPPGHLPPVCGRGDERFDAVTDGREYLASSAGGHLIVGLHVIRTTDAAASIAVYERAQELFADCTAFEEGAAVAGPRWWVGDLLLKTDSFEEVAAGDQAFAYQATAREDLDGELAEAARVCWSYARVGAAITVTGLFEDASAPAARCDAITTAAAEALGDGNVPPP